MAYDTIAGVVVNSQGLVRLLFNDSSAAGWHQPGSRTYGQGEALAELRRWTVIAGVAVTADTNQVRLRERAEAKAQRFAALAGLPYRKPFGW